MFAAGPTRYAIVSMRYDVFELDRALLALRDRRRAAMSALASAPADAEAPPSPFQSPLFRMHAELEETDDPVAQAIVRWLDVMVVEGLCWDHRARLERLWRTEHRIRGVDDALSLAEIRRRFLREGTARLAAVYGDGLEASAHEASACAVTLLARRLEREGDRYFATDGQPMAVDLAQRVLTATADVVEGTPPGLLAAARAAIGREAGEGWPARLTSRWLAELFEGTPLTQGLEISLGRLPPPWGAMSFARALGQLGAATLDASRPAAMPFSLHKRPRGHRRHARRALFASIVLERPFAKRVLDLGADRVRDHRRHVAVAMAHSVRFDALRVLATARLRDGEAAGREGFAELCAHHARQSESPALLGVLPRLRPADGPALVGAVVAFAQRAALIAAHEEDWFRNPRAVELIRHENELATGPAPDDALLERGVREMHDVLEEAAG